MPFPAAYQPEAVAVLSARLIVWKEPATWFQSLALWLEPRMVIDGRSRLAALGEQNLCWDDSEWLDVLDEVLLQDHEALVEPLAEALADVSVRAYHGCRVPDAGAYARDGLKLNQPAAMHAQVRQIVAEADDLAGLRPSLERRLAEFACDDRDTAWLHVGLDDRVQLDHAGHYMLYGSEWLMAFLGEAGHATLRGLGVATMLEIDLPLDWTSSGTRGELAQALLQQWTRVAVNAPDWSPQIDFTFSLRHDLPAHCIVGHYHPEVLVDNHHGFIRRRQLATTCPACGAASGAAT